MARHIKKEKVAKQKLLDGSELALFIKERQAGNPKRILTERAKLAIIVTVDNPVINTYMKMKKRYGEDIRVDVDVHQVEQKDCKRLIGTLNNDPSVSGIIIQLPLADPAQTDELTKLVDPKKDVDGLGSTKFFDPATPMAILWLLSGYNIDLKDKHILLIGQGKLVGRPLSTMFKQMNLDVAIADRDTKDLKSECLKADLIITATGSPAIIFPDYIKSGAVIVDAGVASEDGKVVGDLDSSVYDRQDITVTPTKGGVGPLTVVALFENVLKAYRLATAE
jgi:methylenetetrahydrofolate dehydrogenase (NADP+) / methenyltetrahydrofolate cyclohydrolase